MTPRSKTFCTVPAGQPASSVTLSPTSASVNWSRHGDRDLGRALQVCRQLGAQRRRTSRRPTSTTRSPRNSLSKEWRHRPLAGGGEHGDRADQRHADHQRRGGGCRAPRVAHRRSRGRAGRGSRRAAAARAPSTRTTGRASTGASVATPRNAGQGRRAAPAGTAPADDAARPPRRRCRRSAASPIGDPPAGRAGPARPRPSRIAATGATRAARRAGSSADATVTTSPTTKAISSERGETTSGPSGMATPSSARAALDALRHADAGQQPEAGRDARRRPAPPARRCGGPGGHWHRSPAAAPAPWSAARPGSRRCC